MIAILSAILSLAAVAEPAAEALKAELQSAAIGAPAEPAPAVPDVGALRESGPGLAYSCSFIDTFCERISTAYRKAGHRSCSINFYSEEYIQTEKRSCERERAQPLAVENLSGRRYKAWLLEYEGMRILRSVYEHAWSKRYEVNSPVQPEGGAYVRKRPGVQVDPARLRVLLDLMAQAIAPIRSEASVARRFNQFPDERLQLAEVFADLLYVEPSVGNDYLQYVYDLSRFDAVDDIRARMLDFAYHADQNRPNAERLLAYHRSGATQIFSGSVAGGRASWTLEHRIHRNERRGSNPEETVADLGGGGGTLYRPYNKRLNSGVLIW